MSRLPAVLLCLMLDLQIHNKAAVNVVVSGVSYLAAWASLVLLVVRMVLVHGGHASPPFCPPSLGSQTCVSNNTRVPLSTSTSAAVKCSPNHQQQ